MPAEQLRNLKVKVGLLGVTHPHADAHLRTLELLDEVESISAWDEGEIVVDALKIENRPKMETTQPTLEQILNRQDIPIIISLGSNSRNPDWIIRAAGAGKHIQIISHGDISSHECNPTTESQSIISPALAAKDPDP